MSWEGLSLPRAEGGESEREHLGGIMEGPARPKAGPARPPEETRGSPCPLHEDIQLGHIVRKTLLTSFSFLSPTRPGITVEPRSLQARVQPPSPRL